MADGQLLHLPTIYAEKLPVIYELNTTFTAFPW